MNGITNRVAGIGLAASAVLGLVGAIIVLALGREVPSSYWAVVTGSITALAALLVPGHATGEHKSG